MGEAHHCTDNELYNVNSRLGKEGRKVVNWILIVGYSRHHFEAAQREWLKVSVKYRGPCTGASIFDAYVAMVRFCDYCLTNTRHTDAGLIDAYRNSIISVF